MKFKIIIALTFISTSLLAQNSEYELFMNTVRKNSPTISALQKRLEADKIGNRTGIAPDDPEADITVFPKKNTTFEMNIVQSIEFPTVYTNRSKISKLNNQRSEASYLNEVRTVLNEARSAYFDAIYYNRKLALIEKSRSNAMMLQKMYEKRVETGDATRLEKNKIDALMLEVSTQYRQAIMGRENILNQIRTISGATVNNVADTIYPLFVFGSKGEFSQTAINNNYILKVNTIDTLIAQRTLKLSRAEWMPGIKAGYRLEMDNRTATSGIIAGLSIPLWKNANRIKYAKMNISATRAQNESMKRLVNTEISNLYTTYDALKISLDEYYSFKDKTNTLELINKALKYGEISMLEYFVELNIWYSIEDRIIELERESSQVAAQMSGYYDNNN